MACEKMGLYTTAEITRALRGGEAVRDFAGGEVGDGEGGFGVELGVGIWDVCWGVVRDGGLVGVSLSLPVLESCPRCWKVSL